LGSGWVRAGVGVGVRVRVTVRVRVRIRARVKGVGWYLQRGERLRPTPATELLRLVRVRVRFRC